MKLFARRSWAWPRDLRARGLLGINGRNGDYVLPDNPRCHYPRVDDKVQTKRICEARGIPVPQTYAVIERQGDIRRFAELVRERPEFVVKPAHGAEGRGIIVIVEHDNEIFRTAGGHPYELADLCYHLSTALSGLYSLGGQPDAVIVEQRIVRHPAFERVAVGGTPDIRVILYRSVPVMAMARLPTRESRGRANLHQGAIAAAIHLHTGETYGGVCHDHVINAHPDTGATIEGLRIPFWDKLLAAASNLADALELGYVGVDFVLDATVGPVVLEANARPGLAIQLANRCGLQPRLEFIARQPADALAPERRLELTSALAEMH
ncbi:MAG: alpha-L-glutamate ligase-like protein [Verrucomicrobia bacterium]|nr:alpha-L-glutamate ligase-like protein [Verrucomicrobiota bacterium]